MTQIAEHAQSERDKVAGWRLKTGKYKFPIEQKIFDVYVKLTGQTQPGAVDYVPAVDA